MQWEILNIQKLKVKLNVQIVHVAATVHGIIDMEQNQSWRLHVAHYTEHVF